MAIVVKVQAGDFDVGAELAAMRIGRPEVGAIASFIGIVRDVNAVAGERSTVGALTLEHYPGMTERALEAICAEASGRWSLVDLLVIHRHGRLLPTDQIVFVAASAAHRGEAFDACNFVMDYLKTQAPFWKKETTDRGERWVEARDSDVAAAARWRVATVPHDA
jgi:molybdopterin synthase catalytic subunit